MAAVEIGHFYNPDSLCLRPCDGTIKDDNFAVQWGQFAFQVVEQTVEQSLCFELSRRRLVKLQPKHDPC